MSILLRAFVVGYTGETGKNLVKVLAHDPRYGSVKLIGRREVEVDYGIDAESASKKFSQHVIDFDQLDDHQSLFSETDVGFCAIGTTVGKSGKELMRKIEHDYVIKMAGFALSSGCKEFHIISSKGADPKSHFFYLRLKGEIEEDLKSTCVFPNFLAIYRPGVLQSNRTESRFGERFVNTLLTPVYKLYPTKFSVAVTTLAKAMANAPFCLTSMVRSVTGSSAGDSVDPKVHVIENDMIFKLASDSAEPSPNSS